MAANNIAILVTAETNCGSRSYMEDYFAVCLSPDDTLMDVPELQEQAYVGVFDGHGGEEAAKYVRDNMWKFIQAQPEFNSSDVQGICQSIAKAYQELHNDMLNYRASWKCRKTGDLSTAGTTACTVIFRKDHIFVANVGDSTAVMGVKNSRYGELDEPATLAKVLTVDHKPENPQEQERVKSLGGKVMMSPRGVMRVVWERPKKALANSGQNGVDQIPFLGVTRSLGDFWSYNPRTKKFVVSPTPDVHVYPMDLSTQKFVVVASDGLWNVMTPQEAVNFIYEYENQVTDCNQPKDVVSAIIKEALDRWDSKRVLADNIAVLIAFLSEEREAELSTVTSRESSKPAAECPATPICTEASAIEAKDKEPRKPCPIPTSILPFSEPEVFSSTPSSSPLPVPISLPPLSTCSSEPSLFHSISHSKSGILEFYREQQPCGITIQYESKIKHERKRTLPPLKTEHNVDESLDVEEDLDLGPCAKLRRHLD